MLERSLKGRVPDYGRRRWLLGRVGPLYSRKRGLATHSTPLVPACSNTQVVINGRGYHHACNPPSTKGLNNHPILSPPKGGHLRLPVLSSLQPPPWGGAQIYDSLC